MNIIIDDRERSVIPYFDSFEEEVINYKVKRLEVGDYSIVKHDKIIAIIERKTWADLSSSICDGRIHNMEKMIKVREQNSCRLYMLIEGKRLKASDLINHRMPYKNIESYLDHIMYRDNIFVIYSNDELDSARRIYSLSRNLSTLDEIKNISGGSDVNLLNEKTELSDFAIKHLTISAIPNITPNMANVLCKADITFRKLYDDECSVNELAALVYESGNCFGSKKAKSIIRGIEMLKTDLDKQILFLSKIPSISKQTSKEILENFDFETLCGIELTIEKLSNIKVGKSKKKLGMKKSILINSCLLV